MFCGILSIFIDVHATWMHYSILHPLRKHIGDCLHYYVVSTIHIGVHQSTARRFEHATPYSAPCIFTSLLGVFAVQKTALACVAFFLLNNFNTLAIA